MRYPSFVDILLIKGQPQKRVRAFTLVELLITMAIIGTLGAIAVPAYTNHMNDAKNAAAIVDIRQMEYGILRFQTERGRLPDTLAEAGLSMQRDPWGRPYEYLRIQGLDPAVLSGNWRKDRSANPLNTDFDLYSHGKDGQSKKSLVVKESWDDIVRANNGVFVGLASEF